jgi:hypothetical protein
MGTARTGRPTEKDPWIGNSGGAGPNSITGILAIKTPDHAVFTWSGYPQRIVMVRHTLDLIACAG